MLDPNDFAGKNCALYVQGLSEVPIDGVLSVGSQGDMLFTSSSNVCTVTVSFDLNQADINILTDIVEITLLEGDKYDHPGN